MHRLAEFTSLGLRPLSDLLAAGHPAHAELSPGEWLGVLELLTLRLVEGCDGLSAEDWARCSKAVAHTLDAAQVAGAIDRPESVIRRLNLAVALLRRVAPNPRVDILDPDTLLPPLVRELPVSAQEARLLSADWRSLELAQIRRLRLAKNLLSPALQLAELVPDGQFAARLKPWEEILPSLP